MVKQDEGINMTLKGSSYVECEGNLYTKEVKRSARGANMPVNNKIKLRGKF